VRARQSVLGLLGLARASGRVRSWHRCCRDDQRLAAAFARDDVASANLRVEVGLAHPGVGPRLLDRRAASRQPKTPSCTSAPASAAETESNSSVSRTI